MEYTPVTPVTPTSTSTTTPAPAPTVSMRGKLIRIVAESRNLGGHKAEKGLARDAEVTTGAQEGAVSSHRHPFTHIPEVRAARTAVAHCLKVVEKHAVRTGRKSEFIIKTARFVAFEQELAEAQMSLADAVDRLEAVWEQRLREAPAAMGRLFNPADYPPVEELRSRMAFAFRPTVVTHPSEVHGMADIIVKTVREDYDEILEGSRKAMVAQLVELLTAMFETLKEAKRLRANSWDKLAQFCSTVRELLPEPDPAVEQHVADVEQFLSIVDRDTAASSDEVRQTAATYVDMKLTQLKDLL